MANNVNLGTARAVYAAIAHTMNNYYRFTNVGMIAALRDPSSKEIQDATNPFLLSQADGGKTVLPYKGGTYNPRIQLTYTPAYSGGSRTSRTALGGNAGSNGVANIAAASTLEFEYSKHIEFEIVQSLFTSDIFAEPLTLEYLDKLAKPELRIEAFTAPRYAGVRAALVKVGNEIMRRLDADMLVPVDDDLITTMAAGVGKNVGYAWDSINGTVDAPITQVFAFESDGETPSPNFWNYIQNTKRTNMFQGMPILVAGQKMAEYMQLRKIVSVADSGFRLDAMINDLPVHWYYDARIDSILGENEGLMWDSGAAALQTWLDHSPYGLVRTKKAQNMDYGNATINVAQYRDNIDASRTPANISLQMDLRVLEGLDAADFPTERIAPSMRYGVFKRPVGYFTSDNTKPLYGVTGIYRFKLNNKS